MRNRYIVLTVIPQDQTPKLPDFVPARYDDYLVLHKSMTFLLYQRPKSHGATHGLPTAAASSSCAAAAISVPAAAFQRPASPSCSSVSANSNHSPQFFPITATTTFQAASSSSPAPPTFRPDAVSARPRCSLVNFCPNQATCFHHLVLQHTPCFRLSPPGICPTRSS